MFSISNQSIKDQINPLVSVVLTTYNQPELSLISLRSLLVQDYRNLEIIISDDSSTDNTYELLSEECEKYKEKGGKHTIYRHKNPQNLGITHNYEQAFKMSHGKLIVVQGGDDIAYSNRISTIVEYWLAGGEKAKVIFHKLRPIDINGHPYDYEWWNLTLRNPIGAAMAYSRDIIDRFPAISFYGAFEDNIFARRAALLGEELHIDKILIDYRIGSGMTSSGNQREKRIKISKAMVESTRQNYIDLEFIKDIAIPIKHQAIKNLVDEVYHTYSLEYDMINGESAIIKIRSFAKYIKCSHRIEKPNFYGVTMVYIPRMFPTLGKFTIALHESGAWIKKLLAFK